jgi:hypothetical protein
VVRGVSRQHCPIRCGDIGSKLPVSRCSEVGQGSSLVIQERPLWLGLRNPALGYQCDLCTLLPFHLSLSYLPGQPGVVLQVLATCSRDLIFSYSLSLSLSLPPSLLPHSYALVATELGSPGIQSQCDLACQKLWLPLVAKCFYNLPHPPVPCWSLLLQKSPGWHAQLE